MPALITRRTMLAGSVLGAPALLLSATAGAAEGQAALGELERRNGGRLGVAILDVVTGHHLEYRGDERFPLCSTFKLLAASRILQRVDLGQEHLDRRIVFSKQDLVDYSPETSQHVGEEGMTLAEICKAALTLSDNTAGNLMLSSLGGPGAITAFARSLGDDITRLDRTETALNEAAPGDPRDTTSPLAMLGNLRKLVLGDTLSTGSGLQLIAWLTANKTGDKRLRAGLPVDWRVGDKTGAGNNGATNDIAVAWRPDHSPVIVTAYYVESKGTSDQRNAVIAEVGRIAASV